MVDFVAEVGDDRRVAADTNLAILAIRSIGNWRLGFCVANAALLTQNVPLRSVAAVAPRA
jgi:hypothetical protein